MLHHGNSPSEKIDKAITHNFDRIPKNKLLQAFRGCNIRKQKLMLQENTFNFIKRIFKIFIVVFLYFKMDKVASYIKKNKHDIYISVFTPRNL